MTIDQPTQKNFFRWVNMPESVTPIPVKLHYQRVGQHPRMVGQHKSERWVNMEQNLQNSIDDLENAGWLFGPRSMHSWPNLRKESRWKSLGMLSAPSDAFVPDFKGVQTTPKVVEDESKIGPWYPIHNLTKRGANCEYSQVQHLEMKILTVSSLSLSWRTGMEYCRINGLPVNEYYNLNSQGEKLMYFQMINIPLYKDIPDEIRGRSLTILSN